MEPEQGSMQPAPAPDDAACRLTRTAAAAQQSAGCSETGRDAQAPHDVDDDAAPRGGGGVSRKAAAAADAADKACGRPRAVSASDCRPVGDQHPPTTDAAGDQMQLDCDGGAAANARLRGWQAMLCSPRQQPPGPLELPGLHDGEGGGAAGLERLPSSSSTHRSLLHGGAPSPAPSSSHEALTSPATTAGGGAGDVQGMDVDAAAPPPAAAAGGAGAASAADEEAAAAAAAPLSRRPPAAGGPQRPTVVIPGSPAPGAMMASGGGMGFCSPGGTLLRPYSGPMLCVDELDLDAIDDIVGIDSSAGLSSSSSPVVSGASAGGGGGGRSTPGSAHALRSSRDHDLRRAALMNQLLSPRPGGTPTVGQPPAAASVLPALSGGLSIQAEGPGGAAPMFTGPTRARAGLPQAGSNTSLTSLGADSSDLPPPLPQQTVMQLMQSMRASRGNTPLPSPMQGRGSGGGSTPGAAPAFAGGGSMLGTAARTPPGAPGSSRGGSVPGSPAPAPTHGQAAALLAGSVLASPRTPHSPLSVMLSPGPCSSQRALLPHAVALPGPAFSHGLVDSELPSPARAHPMAAGVAGTTPGSSPATSCIAAPSSTASSCHTASGQFAAAMQQRGSLLSPAASRLGPSAQGLLMPLPRGSSDPDLTQQQPEVAMTAEQLQQFHLRQQVQQHDTRFGPHGESPLSPSHHLSAAQHQQQQQLRAGAAGSGALLSPTRPAPQVPPALTLLMQASSGQHATRADQLAYAPAAATPGAPAAAAAAAHAAPPAAGASPAGEFGRDDSIHEWLDHHSWQLRLRPEQLPMSLRDAADVREATGAPRGSRWHHQQQQQQQAHQQQQQHHHSRASSQLSGQGEQELTAALTAARGLGGAAPQEWGRCSTPPPPMSTCSTPDARVMASAQHATALQHTPASSALLCSPQRASDASWLLGGDGGGPRGMCAHHPTAAAGGAGHTPRATAGHTRLAGVRPARLAVAAAAAAAAAAEDYIEVGNASSPSAAACCVVAVSGSRLELDGDVLAAGQQHDDQAPPLLWPRSHQGPSTRASGGGRCRLGHASGAADMLQQHEQQQQLLQPPYDEDVWPPAQDQQLERQQLEQAAAAVAVACSGDTVAAPTAGSSNSSTTAALGLALQAGEAGGGGGNAAGEGAGGPLGAILRDEAFVAGLLASLPGVEPGCVDIAAALAGLRAAAAQPQCCWAAAWLTDDDAD